MRKKNKARKNSEVAKEISMRTGYMLNQKSPGANIMEARLKSYLSGKKDVPLDKEFALSVMQELIREGNVLRNAGVAFSVLVHIDPEYQLDDTLPRGFFVLGVSVDGCRSSYYRVGNEYVISVVEA